MCLSNRKSSCRKISFGLAAQEFVVYRRAINKRLCEVGLKAYIPRKKPRLTEKTEASHHACVEQSNWTSTDWEQIRKVCLVQSGFDFNFIKLFARLFSRTNHL